MLKINGIPEGISKQEILIKLKNYKEPSFVDHIPGKDSCIVRYCSPKDRSEFLEIYKERIGASNFKMKSQVLQVNEITGQEESDYLEKVKIKREKLKKIKKR